MPLVLSRILFVLRIVSTGKDGPRHACYRSSESCRGSCPRIDARGTCRFDMAGRTVHCVRSAIGGKGGGVVVCLKHSKLGE